MQATAEAADAGADITVAVLDRNTGDLVTNGRNNTIAIASVVKLFIADDLLLQEAKGNHAEPRGSHHARRDAAVLR